MAAAAGPAAALAQHLGPFTQAEVDALLLPDDADVDPSSSWFTIEVDAQGVLWLVQKPEAEERPADKASVPHQQQQPPMPQSCSMHDSELLCDLMDLKASFEQTPRSRFSAARARSNPYEALVSGSPFLNRSALKMANLNHLVGGALLSPPPPQQQHQQQQYHPALFTFADLCGGPGGFSQYVLATHEAKGRPVWGWGITLEGDKCPWDVEKLGRWLVGASTAAGQHQPMPPPRPAGQSLRLLFGADGTGDLCNRANILDFAGAIRGELRAARGDTLAGAFDRVDLVMADGGFADARSRFDQEGRMLPLVIGEVWTMAETLKVGGHFTCKIFDATLPGTVQVLALLACLFDRVALVKPVTSRPASAERYLVCLGRRPAHRGNTEVGSEAEKLVTEMLCGMLTHATEGHMDGHQGASDDLGPAAFSPVLWHSWRMVLGADTVSAAWLRAVNDRSMRCQVEGCHAILEAIERMEEGEKEHDGEGTVAAVDVQAYMKAWGLGAFSGREGEERGQTAEELDGHVRKKQKS